MSVASWTFFTATVLALACVDCGTFVHLETGYAHAFAQAPERSTAQADLYMGIHLPMQPHAGAGVGAAIRTKWSDNVQQLSAAPYLYGFVAANDSKAAPPVAAFVTAGFDLLTVEWVTARSTGSIGSPFVELGGIFRIFREVTVHGSLA